MNNFWTSVSRMAVTGVFTVAFGCLSKIITTPCCRLVAKKCNGNRAGGQGFRLTWRKDVRYQSASGSCWDVSEGGQRAKVTRFACHGAGGNQYWKYDLVRASYGNTLLFYNQSSQVLFKITVQNFHQQVKV